MSKRTYEDALPNNPRFAKKVEWKDAIFGARTSACFAPDGAMWLVQDGAGIIDAPCIFLSPGDAKRLAEMIANSLLKEEGKWVTT